MCTQHIPPRGKITPHTLNRGDPFTFLHVQCLQEFNSTITQSPKPPGKLMVRRYSPYARQSDKGNAADKGNTMDKRNAMDERNATDERNTMDKSN